MIARRLTFSTLVVLCTLACVLVLGASSAWAGGGSFLFGSPGKEAGQIAVQGSSGMAVDQQSGDVYVGDPANQRVEKFNRSGEFLLGWGWGVIPPSNESEFQGANEFQVCTSATECREGRPGSGGGEFSEQSVTGLAVDNEPLSSSRGDVYVVDSNSFRVEEFDPQSKFVRMFGGHVNRNGTNMCAAGEAAECQAGVQGEGDGEFNWAFERSAIAVGPGGDVYVGDKARVQVFEPSGAWKESISLSALSSEGKVTALAVNAVGDVFVKDEGVPGVRGFEPGGIEMAAKFDEGSEKVESIALDASGDLFVLEGSLFEEGSFKEYGPSGEELEAFGGHTLVRIASAMAFDDVPGELLVYGSDQTETSEYGHEGVWSFPVPSPGPQVASGSESAGAELRGAATLQALVDPEGSATEVKFEYVDNADFTASGYADAVSTSPQPVGSSFEDQHVEVQLPQKTLVPGVGYHWRVVAKNAQGADTGEDQSVEEIPAAYLEGPWATGVTDASVTLSARIDPLGASTSYRLEYGTSSSYGHVFAGSVGEGTSYMTISDHIQELVSNTVYHYRLVTENEVGIVESADGTFATQLPGGSLTTADDRAWELVSPPNKGSALIEEVNRAQAAADGSGITYTASEPIGEGIVGHVGSNINPTAGATLLSRRGTVGWQTRDISPKQSLPPEEVSAKKLFDTSEGFYLFTPDLSTAIFEPRNPAVAPQSDEVTEHTLYLRDNASEVYRPLVTPANVPPGVKFGAAKTTYEEISFEAATPDLSHVIFASSIALTPEAHYTGEEASDANLYEWGGGQLKLVNILPKNESVTGAGFSNSEGDAHGSPTPDALSSDGRWVIFNYTDAGFHRYYVRDMVDGRTVPFGSGKGHTDFETMSSDGSRIFYVEPESGATHRRAFEGELYVFDPATGKSTDLTADHLEGERSAQAQDTLMGTSEDGSYVYFVAKGVLASGATKGANNLYLLHDNNGAWTTRFIATLSSEDQKGWSNVESAPSLEVRFLSSRVSSNGRFLSFMSNRPLTGYDNRDALSGQPDEEAYLYDASADRLVCASCNPTGARPVGLFDANLAIGSSGEHPLMDSTEDWDGRSDEPEFYGGHWIAAVLAPSWHEAWTVPFYQPRSLSDSGRLFFDSSDALVPQDTNGLADVYEYEQSGVGDCTTVSVTFSERSDGCVGLISSGQSATESTFFDASENGDDAFFITAAKLVGEDYDTAFDVYDAHVCTSAVPCGAAPVSSPPCTSGDSCKAAPSPQPAIFGPAPSATFNGTGNVVASPSSGSTVRPRSLTRAQKLRRALRACAKKRDRKRVVCERQARKRYRAKQSRARAKATRKGNG